MLDPVRVVVPPPQFVCTTPKSAEPEAAVGRLSALSSQQGVFTVSMHTVVSATPGTMGGYACLVEFSSTSRCCPVFFRRLFDTVIAGMTRCFGVKDVICQVGVPSK